MGTWATRAHGTGRRISPAGSGMRTSVPTSTKSLTFGMTTCHCRKKPIRLSHAGRTGRQPGSTRLSPGRKQAIVFIFSRASVFFFFGGEKRVFFSKKKKKKKKKK